MNIKIMLLADLSIEQREKIVNVLAEWNYNAWNKYDAAVTVERSKERFEQRALNRDRLPLTLIAINEDIVKIEDSIVGTVTLKESVPISGYDDKKPWLGSLMVLEPYQKQGVGTKLENKTSELAAALGFKEIFLFTSVSYMPQWYSSQNRGWEFLSKDTYPQGDPKEHQITIMKKRLVK